MFHNISTDYCGRGTISPEAFAADLDTLLYSGYHIISMNQFVAFLKGAAVPANAVMITFDDGFEGVYRYAYPLLKQQNIPATVFLIADYIGKKTGFLTWPQIREMSASGLFTIGAHTFNAHYSVPTSPKTSAPATIGRIYNLKTHRKETDKEYRDRILADSFCAQQVFNRELGHDTPYFAYPYGAYTVELDQILRIAGYKYFFTTLAGLNGSDDHTFHFYRINAGVPALSPERLVTRIQCTALLHRSPRKTPQNWLPRWAKEPALSLIRIS